MNRQRAQEAIALLATRREPGARSEPSIVHRFNRSQFGGPVPYVTQDSRTRLDAGRPPADAGELNYVLTRVVDRYLSARAAAEGRTRYAHLNEAIGVLECAKLELYRRVAAPYEDEKCSESGDVYGVLG